MTVDDTPPQAQRKLERDAILATAGNIAPWKISAILALDASVEDLDRAVAWASVEEGSGLHHIADDRRMHHHKAAGIYDILVSDRTEADSDG